jgi:hypothetical protein
MNQQTDGVAIGNRPLIHCDLALARRLERAEGRANAEFVDARRPVFPERAARWIEVAARKHSASACKVT